MTELESALRGAGLRITRPRVEVLRAVRSHPHAQTHVLIAEARTQLPTLSHQAVYDTLHRLTAVGLVRCIQPAGSAARYETRIGDNHHHAICRSCGDIVDVDCVLGEAPCMSPGADHGFAIDTAEVVYWGTCPRCAA